MPPDLLLVLSTFPDTESAKSAARTLVAERLTACTNLIPGIESIYHWEGKIEESPEVQAIFKVPSSLHEKFTVRLAELHPYDIPEIVSILPTHISNAYAIWAQSACNRRS